jgi:small ligand-binding sensory domain FIST
VQFQVRDAESAHDDLVAVLRDGTGGPADVASMTARAAGALVFTCNGRGSRLFAEPNHDATAVGSVVPRGVAGMFCAGELGPVGGRNAVHGFTATVLLFP